MKETVSGSFSSFCLCTQDFLFFTLLCMLSLKILEPAFSLYLINTLECYRQFIWHEQSLLWVSVFNIPTGIRYCFDFYSTTSLEGQRHVSRFVTVGVCPRACVQTMSIRRSQIPGLQIFRVGGARLDLKMSPISLIREVKTFQHYFGKRRNWPCGRYLQEGINVFYCAINDNWQTYERVMIRQIRKMGELIRGTVIWAVCWYPVHLN